MKRTNLAGTIATYFFLLFSTLLLFSSCKNRDVDPPAFTNLTSKQSGQVATDWFDLLTNMTRSAGYPPAPSLRLYAYNGLALYESVMPGMPSYQSLFKHLANDGIAYDETKEYYWPACANAAMASLTKRILQNYPTPSPNLAPVQELEARLNARFQSQVSAERLQYSIEFGQAVADKIYAYSTADGTLTPSGSLASCPPYSPLGTPGTWVPTPPAFASAAGACQGNLRTFVPNIATTTLPPPPPAYSTTPGSAYHNMASEIYQISQNLTAEDQRIALSWRDLSPNFNPPSHVMRVSVHIAVKEQLNLEDAAVLFAQEGLAVADAVTSVFKAKYHYALQRPITYIRSVMGHSTWNTLMPTPQHPAYPSTAVAASSAVVQVLEKRFGTSYPVVDSTQHSLHGTFTYPSLNAFLQDVGKARTHSGINFKASVEAAVTQGRSVANAVLQLPMKK